MSKNGVISFDHPLNKVRAIGQEDEKGDVSAMDLFTRLQSIPRWGSASNWVNLAVVEGECAFVSVEIARLLHLSYLYSLFLHQENWIGSLFYSISMKFKML